MPKDRGAAAGVVYRRVPPAVEEATGEQERRQNWRRTCATSVGVPSRRGSWLITQQQLDATQCGRVAVWKATRARCWDLVSSGAAMLLAAADKYGVSMPELQVAWRLWATYTEECRRAVRGMEATQEQEDLWVGVPHSCEL